MDPFINYPPEMIQKICNDLDTPSLLKASESSSRILQVCSDIIKERRSVYLERKSKIKEFKNIIESYRFITFNKNTNYGKVVVSIMKLSKDYIVEQSMYPLGFLVPQEIPQEIPWILPFDFKINWNQQRIFTQRNKNINEISEILAANLVDQGYSLQSVK